MAEKRRKEAKAAMEEAKAKLSGADSAVEGGEAALAAALSAAKERRAATAAAIMAKAAAARCQDGGGCGTALVVELRGANAWPLSARVRETRGLSLRTVALCGVVAERGDAWCRYTVAFSEIVIRLCLCEEAFSVLQTRDCSRERERESSE